MNSNPLFQDGDELYRGVIHVEVPEIDEFIDDVWTSLLTAGAASARVNPVFFCGQSAMAMAVGQMPKPAFRKEDDYGFIDAAGIEMAYGIGKVFRKWPKSGTKLIQQFHILMCSETVVLNYTTPVCVDHLFSLLFRTDSIHPVILICKAAARPAEHRYLHFL